MSSSGLRRVASVGGGLVAAIGLASIAAVLAHTAGAASPSRRVLPWVRPSWTSAVTKTGDVPSNRIMRAKVWLAPRNASQLLDLAKAVSQPGNAQYGKFVTADQYRAQFAPTQTQVTQVTQWLSGAGLSVTKVGPDNHYVAVSGTAAAIQNAFGTELGTFTVNGRQTHAPSTDVSVPESVAGFVLAITGLSPYGHMAKPGDFGAPDAFVNATPCSSYYGEKKGGTPQFKYNKYVPYAVCGYVPSQLRAVYGIGSSNVGAGETVAFVDAYDAPTLVSDSNQYATNHGDPPLTGGQFTDKSVPEDASTGDDCGGNSWYGEQSLDLQAIHGMALAANVLYYGAASCFDDDLLASLASAVSDDQASIVSNSWGEPSFVRINGQVFPTQDQNSINSFESVFIQGAVQGMGFYFSSGDDGDDEAAWGLKHPDYPAGDPWVTAVGGTALGVGPQNQRLFETGWGTAKYVRGGNGWTLDSPFLYGSGGGYSKLFERPLYQLGIAPMRNGGRGVPDIAMDGDVTTGMLVGETQSFSGPSIFGGPGILYGEARYGGTSLSVQLFAGVQADAQEVAGGSRIGFANPLIYLLQGRRGVYNDIFMPAPDAGNARVDYVNQINGGDGVVYSLRTFNEDSSLKIDRGWDDVTGVGTPTAQYLTAVANVLP